MCWSANASLATLIIGTVINGIILRRYYNKEEIVIFCLAWQWVLMMQFSEYLIWIDQGCGDTNKIGTQLALIFNLTQPIIVFILCMCTTKVDLQFKVIASVLTLVYISFMFLKLNQNSEYTCVTPSSNSCAHLDLKWWEDFKWGGLVYLIVLISVLLLLFRPFNLSRFVCAYIIIALLVSMKFYSCGAPSIWCWLVVPLPIFVALFYELFVKDHKILV